MEQIMNYVKPELIIVAVALYFIGMWPTGNIYQEQIYSAGTGNHWSVTVRDLGTGHMYVIHRTRRRSGGIHCNCSRRIGGRPEYICKSVYQAVREE